MIRKAFVVALAFQLGCSYMTMRAPAPVDKAAHSLGLQSNTEPDCSTGRAAVAVDVALGAVNASVAGFLFYLMVRDGELTELLSLENQGDFGHGLSLVFYGALVQAALYAGSAVHGVRISTRCREVRQQWGIALYERSHPTVNADGAEGGRCRETSPRCDSELACASHFCVRPPPGIFVKTADQEH